MEIPVFLLDSPGVSFWLSSPGAGGFASFGGIGFLSGCFSPAFAEGASGPGVCPESFPSASVIALGGLALAGVVWGCVVVLALGSVAALVWEGVAWEGATLGRGTLGSLSLVGVNLGPVAVLACGLSALSFLSSEAAFLVSVFESRATETP